MIVKWWANSGKLAKWWEYSGTNFTMFHKPSPNDRFMKMGISLEMGWYLLWPPVWLANGMVFKAWVCHMFVESPNQSSNKILVLVLNTSFPKRSKTQCRKGLETWKINVWKKHHRTILVAHLSALTFGALGLVLHQNGYALVSSNMANWKVHELAMGGSSLQNHQTIAGNFPASHVWLLEGISTSRSDQLR